MKTLIWLLENIALQTIDAGVSAHARSTHQPESGIHSAAAPISTHPYKNNDTHRAATFTLSGGRSVACGTRLIRDSFCIARRPKTQRKSTLRRESDSSRHYPSIMSCGFVTCGPNEALVVSG